MRLWRIFATADIIVYFLVVSSMEKNSAAIAHDAQKSQTALTSAVLEYEQGRHEELIGQEGIYAGFVLDRKEAIGWKLEA